MSFMAPRAQIEEDLQEVAAIDPLVPRVWLSGGDPFTMSTHRLGEFGTLVKSYLPRANLGTYARIDSTFHKSVHELKELRASATTLCISRQSFQLTSPA